MSLHQAPRQPSSLRWQRRRIGAGLAHNEAHFWTRSPELAQSHDDLVEGPFPHLSALLRFYYDQSCLKAGSFSHNDRRCTRCRLEIFVFGEIQAPSHVENTFLDGDIDVRHPAFQGRRATHLALRKCPPLAVCHECRLSMTVRNCTRDEGGPFEVGNQVLISSHRKLLSSKAMVVSVA